MLKRIGAIILLIMFAALLVNLFVFQYKLEITMTIYIIVMIAGVIMIVKGSLDSHSVIDITDEGRGEDDTEALQAENCDDTENSQCEEAPGDKKDI